MNNGARSKYQKQVIDLLGSVMGEIQTADKNRAKCDHDVIIPLLDRIARESRDEALITKRRLAWIGLAMMLNLILSIISLLKF